MIKNKVITKEILSTEEQTLTLAFCSEEKIIQIEQKLENGSVEKITLNWDDSINLANSIFLGLYSLDENCTIEKKDFKGYEVH